MDGDSFVSQSRFDVYALFCSFTSDFVNISVMNGDIWNFFLVAYAEKSGTSTEEKTSSAATIAAVIGIVVFLALAAFAAFFILRRRTREHSDTKMTMIERMALRGQSKEDLFRSDIMMSNVVSLFKLALVCFFARYFLKELYYLAKSLREPPFHL